MITWEAKRGLLQLQFGDDIHTLLLNSPFSWVVTWGARTLEEQGILYQAYLKGGPLAAPPGKSAHNFGLAVDVVLITDGKYDYNIYHAGWIWLFFKILNHPRLHSGKGFGDADHIERYQWWLHKAA